MAASTPAAAVPPQPVASAASAFESQVLQLTSAPASPRPPHLRRDGSDSDGKEEDAPKSPSAPKRPVLHSPHAHEPPQPWSNRLHRHQELGSPNHPRNRKVCSANIIHMILLTALGLILGAVAFSIQGDTSTDPLVFSNPASSWLFWFAIMALGVPACTLLTCLLHALTKCLSLFRITSLLLDVAVSYQPFLPILTWSIAILVSHRLLIELHNTVHEVGDLVLVAVIIFSTVRGGCALSERLVIRFMARKPVDAARAELLRVLSEIAHIYKVAVPTFNVDIEEVARKAAVRKRFRSATHRALMLERLSLHNATDPEAARRANEAFRKRQRLQRPHGPAPRHHKDIKDSAVRALIVLLEYADRRVLVASQLFDFCHEHLAALNRRRSNINLLARHSRDKPLHPLGAVPAALPHSDDPSVQAAFRLRAVLGQSVYTRGAMQMEIHRLHHRWMKLHLAHPDVGVLQYSVIALVKVMIYVAGAIAFLLLAFANPMAIFVPLASMFLGLSFMLGSSAQMVFESLVFVLVRQPFDVGDLVFFGSDPNVYRVDRVGIISSSFLTLTNHKTYFPNQVLAKKKIRNLNRSPHGVVLVELWIGAQTTVTQFQCIKRAMKVLLQSDDVVWRDVPGPRLKITEFADDSSKLRLWIYLDTAYGPQQLGPINAARSTAILYVTSTLRKLGVHYETPPTPAVIRDGGIGASIGKEVGQSFGSALSAGVASAVRAIAGSVGVAGGSDGAFGFGVGDVDGSGPGAADSAARARDPGTDIDDAYVAPRPRAIGGRDHLVPPSPPISAYARVARGGSSVGSDSPAHSGLRRRTVATGAQAAASVAPPSPATSPLAEAAMNAAGAGAGASAMGGTSMSTPGAGAGPGPSAPTGTAAQAASGLSSAAAVRPGPGLPQSAQADSELDHRAGDSAT